MELTTKQIEAIKKWWNTFESPNEDDVVAMVNQVLNMRTLKSSILVGTSKNAKSGYAGVKPMVGRDNYYSAEVRYRGKRVYIGSGSNPEILSNMILQYCKDNKIPYRFESK